MSALFLTSEIDSDSFLLKIWVDITRNALNLVENEKHFASAAGKPSPTVKPVGRVCTDRATPAINTINKNNGKNTSKLPSVGSY